MMIGNVVLVIAGTLTGLLAGLFYTFNVGIVLALRSVNPKAHIEVMQQINTKIENMVFFPSFFGPTILLPLATFLHRDSSQFPLLLIASILHIVGANGITIARNIPLNRELARMDVNQISAEEAEIIRQDFQKVGSAWMRWHNIRTVASILATVLIFIACIIKE